MAQSPPSPCPPPPSLNSSSLLRAVWPLQGRAVPCPPLSPPLLRFTHSPPPPVAQCRHTLHQPTLHSHDPTPHPQHPPVQWHTPQSHPCTMPHLQCPPTLHHTPPEIGRA